MKRVSLISLALLFVLLLNGQERNIRLIPDIPGYQTLICDLHLHSVFSDGTVWPTVRVDEAWHEGIDAIAMTDHLEYNPHKKDISADLNRSWELAKSYARNKDVIVIAGTEITKGMPPGHLNALFIKNANLILQENFMDAVKEASNQGAYIFWNHPGWKAQQPDTMMWWEEHSQLLEKGWLHGIEVANDHSYYPEAINWARDKKLTFIANSDVHSPIQMAYDIEESHRTCTLVFATERSEGAIRDALFSGMTLAYFDNLLMGKEALLKALFFESLFMKKISDEGYVFINPTEMVIKVELNEAIYKDWSWSGVINPQQEKYFKIPAGSEMSNLEVRVTNFLIGNNMCLEVPLSTIRTIHQ